MYTYQQSTGKFTEANGYVLATGYSGRGDAMNNPAMQNVPQEGPIPQGRYKILQAETDPKLGPLAMALEPDPSNDMFERSAFFIHGDNAAMDHTASEGCIILPHVARQYISAGLDRDLQVIA